MAWTRALGKALGNEEGMTIVADAHGELCAKSDLYNQPLC